MTDPDLRLHNIVLRDDNLVLRPMTENDWETIAPWNQDPDVLWFSEGEDVSYRSMDEIRSIYRKVGQAADMFVFELDTVAIGDGWVQAMNIERILRAFPGRDCRRIDLQLAKPYWSKGIGTRVVHLLTGHAFDTGADLVFAIEVAAENSRSLGAFRNNGYVPYRRIRTPDAKHTVNFDLICRPTVFDGTAPATAQPGTDSVMAADEPAGASIIVYRRSPTLELLVLHRSGAAGGDWTWTPPSGARYPAEPPDECASRELAEETGLPGHPIRLVDCGSEHWWTYEFEVTPEAAIELDEEHDRFEWVSAEEAARRCTPAVVSDALACAVAVIEGS